MHNTSHQRGIRAVISGLLLAVVLGVLYLFGVVLDSFAVLGDSLGCAGAWFAARFHRRTPGSGRPQSHHELTSPSDN